MLQVEARRHLVTALVDSGADGTLLPWEVAEELGIVSTLRRNVGERSIAAGHKIRTWSAAAPVLGSVFTFAQGQGKVICPPVQLRPSFFKLRRFGRGKPTPVLLGRNDFFRTFAVTFEERRAAAGLLRLSWAEPLVASEGESPMPQPNPPLET